jgi:RNA polymerase sigma factor (sigma-70 family)
MEFKLPLKNGAVQSGSRLVIAEHPYSNGWLHQAEFKPPNKKGSEGRPQPSESALASPLDLLRWVEGLPYDLWERGSLLTAGVSEPDMPHEHEGKLRNWKGRACLVLGTCHEYEACQEEVLGSPEVRRLIDDTRDNKIVFWKPGAKLPVRPRLHSEVIEDANALMGLAVRQALAGPHRDSEKWVGRAVTDKVRQIYCEHLNRLNRAVLRRAGRAVQRESADQRVLRVRIEEVLASLTSSEREVIELRYGLRDGQARTQEEVAGLLGISRDRVRQVETRAMGRLRRGRTSQGDDAP